MSEYLPIFVLMVLATLFAAGSFMGARVLGPRRPNSAKSAPYECGIVPASTTPERFPVRFYLIAMIFVIFDIEIIFLYPWAVVLRRLELFGLIEMVVFAVAVFVSFVYLLSNGALDWGPARARRTDDTGRSTDSTIRRIGRDQEAA